MAGGEHSSLDPDPPQALSPLIDSLLVAYHPSNMRVYLRDGSARTILRAATLEIEVADPTF